MKDDKYIFTLDDAKTIGKALAEIHSFLKVIMVCNIAITTIIFGLSLIWIYLK